MDTISLIERGKNFFLLLFFLIDLFLTIVNFVFKSIFHSLSYSIPQALAPILWSHLPSTISSLIVSPHYLKPTHLPSNFTLDQPHLYINGEIITVERLIGQSLNNNDSILFVMIAGNPGASTFFYLPFLSHLSTLSSHSISFLSISFAGHTSASRISSIRNARLYSLDDQINLVETALLDYLSSHSHRQIILAGHSVGAYIAAKILTRSSLFSQYHIASIYLFPTLFDISNTPQGKRLSIPLAYLRWLGVEIIRIINFLPISIRKYLISLHVNSQIKREKKHVAWELTLNKYPHHHHNHHHSQPIRRPSIHNFESHHDTLEIERSIMVTGITDILTPEVVRQFTYMAHTEMVDIKLFTPLSSQLDNYSAQLIFIFTPSDEWNPLHHQGILRKTFPDAKFYSFEVNDQISHSFVLGSSQRVANVVWEEIEPLISKVSGKKESLNIF